MENINLESLIESYKLPESEHKTILESLSTSTFSNRTPEEDPSIMFVIGQPGCGKTTFIQNTDFTDYININSDNYRHLSKYSDEILDKYPTYYTKLTNHDAHLWGDELFLYAANNGYSVLREKAPVNYSLIELIEKDLSNKNLVINLVVTGNLSSLLATRERYEKDILKSKNARLSNIEAHNRCYDLLPDFISKCLELGVKVNYVVPINNEFKTIPVEADGLELLERLRRESNQRVALDFKSRISEIKKAMIDRKAPPQQFDELRKIENIYLEIVNSQNIKDTSSDELGDER